MVDVGKRKRIRGTRQKDPGRRHDVNQLKWLLDFLRTDVMELPGSEFRELHYQMLDFLYGRQIENKKELRDVATDDEFNRKALMQIRGLCNSFLGQILSESEQSQKDGKLTSNNLGEVLYDYRVNRDRVTLVPRQRTHPYGVPANLTGTYRYIPLNAGKQADEPYLRRYFLNNPRIESSNYAFFSRFYDPDIESTALLSLIPLLEKFSLKSISKCDICHAFFKRTNRKQWDLCRPCLTKIKIYHWRSQPENRLAYNEYQSNRAKGLKDETPTQIRDRHRREKKRKGKVKLVK